MTERLPACHCGGDSGINKLNPSAIQRLIAMIKTLTSHTNMASPVTFRGLA